MRKWEMKKWEMEKWGNRNTCAYRTMDNILAENHGNRQAKPADWFTVGSLAWETTQLVKVTLECLGRSCRSRPRHHATCCFQRLFLGLYWPRSELSNTLYMLHTVTMPTSNLGRMPCCFSVCLKNQLGDFSRNGLCIQLLHLLLKGLCLPMTSNEPLHQDSSIATVWKL